MQHKVVFENGRYGKYHLPSKKWILFDKDGNKLGEAGKIQWLEEKNRELK